jgi:diguanylate cyclase (GGDEF)-like protein
MTTPNSRILVGDLNPMRGQRITDALKSGGFEAEWVTSGQEVLDRSKATPPAAVVVDADLPRHHGLDVLKTLKENAETASVRVVILVADGHPHTIQRARLLGADGILEGDVPPESILAEVQAALRDGLPRMPQDQDASDPLRDLILGLKPRSEDENPLLKHITDPATGLYNQAYMELKLNEEFKKARRFSIPLTLVSVGFTAPVPPSEETRAGRRHTRLLNEVAGVLLCESRDIDQVGRHGEHFLLLLPHTDPSGACTMGERILASLSSRGLTVGDEAPATPLIAVGVASLDQGPVESPETLVHRAVEARQQAARDGASHCRLWGADLPVS